MLPAILVLLGNFWKYAPFSCHSGLMNILIVSPPQDMILVPDNFLRDLFTKAINGYFDISIVHSLAPTACTVEAR